MEVREHDARTVQSTIWREYFEIYERQRWQNSVFSYRKMDVQDPDVHTVQSATPKGSNSKDTRGKDDRQEFVSPGSLP